MRILYAIQGTGNGHLSRAMELAPHLMGKASVDLLLSGLSAELKFPYPFKYKYHGLSFYFGSKGGVNYLKSFRHFKPFRFFKDMLNCPVEDYDVVVNDFEPVSAWAARRKKIPVVAVSHQASFFSPKVPLPKWRNRVMEFGMQRLVAPSDDYVGLHYKAYDDQVMVPIIRAELVGALTTDLGHIIVYLPAFSDNTLIKHFNKLVDRKWKIFSKKTNSAYSKGNVEVFPVSREKYNNALLTCHAVLIGGGFQGTSEAMYLKKKMLVIPMYDQYEQQCNAKALENMGIRIEKKIGSNFYKVLSDWLNEGLVESMYTFVPDTSKVADKIIETAQHLIKK